jgi:hypothetical protein
VPGPQQVVAVRADVDLFINARSDHQDVQLAPQ